ncbi:hypothetical protein AB0H76_33545 [Nocardia sp. NPDC050712]|uniref:hypothetical protein n=1 Tax=Nocardia sp. NPDC050712 TaxID=3155518 RepID=UPI0033C23814
MSETSNEVLLDDFENKDNWDVAGPGAGRSHLTTFAEGAPAKELRDYADGRPRADHRALVLLIKSAVDDLEVDLVTKSGESFAVPGQLEALNLWVRSPHASIRLFASLGSTDGSTRDVQLGKVTASAEWQHVQHQLDTPVDGANLLGLKIRLMAVTKETGELMILLDDLTARTRNG